VSLFYRLSRAKSTHRRRGTGHRSQSVDVAVHGGLDRTQLDHEKIGVSISCDVDRLKKQLCSNVPADGKRWEI